MKAINIFMKLIVIQQYNDNISSKIDYEKSGDLQAKEKQKKITSSQDMRDIDMGFPRSQVSIGCALK